MSQNAIILPTTGTVSGLAMATDINNALDTLNTDWSGSSAPSSPETGQRWLDSSTSPPTRRLYDGAQWVAVTVLDGTNHAMRPQWVQDYRYLAKTAAYTVAAADHATLIGVTPTANMSISLPAASAVWVGFRVAVINLYAGGGATPYVVSVAANGSDSIAFPGSRSGLSSVPLADCGHKVTLVCTSSSGWAVVESNVKVAMNVNRNSAQTIGNNTSTKVQLNNVAFDLGGFMDATTNYRYTPTLPGFYLFQAQAGYTAGAVTNVAFGGLLFKNGTTTLSQGLNQFGGTGADVVDVAAISYMNGTDYVELWTTQVTGSSQNIDSTNGRTQLNAIRL
jgi:hypothetical protein